MIVKPVCFQFSLANNCRKITKTTALMICPRLYCREPQFASHRVKEDLCQIHWIVEILITKIILLFFGFLDQNKIVISALFKTISLKPFVVYRKQF
jgi:hypothetical protein